MWNRRSVELFLKDRRKSEADIKAFNERADKLADKDGDFSAVLLDEIIGSSELAHAYEEAWATSPRYQRSSFPLQNRCTVTMVQWPDIDDPTTWGVLP